jgi:hypothetical protein
VFDYDLAVSDETQSTILNVVLDDDCIPRLSYASMMLLKNQARLLIESLLSFLETEGENWKLGKFGLLKNLGLGDVDFESEVGRRYQRFFERKEVQLGMEDTFKLMLKGSRCFLAGRQLHITSAGLQIPEIKLVQAADFPDLLFSRTMVPNHFASVYADAIRRLDPKLKQSYLLSSPCLSDCKTKHE